MHEYIEVRDATPRQLEAHPMGRIRQHPQHQRPTTRRPRHHRQPPRRSHQPRRPNPHHPPPPHELSPRAQGNQSAG
jgi:hypothetical protein